MSNTRKIDVKKLIANAKRPERTVVVNLRGDLIARIQQLETELADVQQRNSDRLASHPDAIKIAQQIHDLETEADDSRLQLTLRALQGPDWRRAIAAHPPNDEQKEQGYISDSAAVVAAVLTDSLAEAKVADEVVELDDDDLTKLQDALSEAQWQLIENTVFQLNGGDNTVPFSRIASHVLQNSEGEPKSPEPGE